MNILVTGGAGYIGSRLVPKLLADGHKVTVLDTQWFGHGYLPTDNQNLTVINGDVRYFNPMRDASLACDAVIWLASVSNNEMYKVNYKLTHDVNKFIEDYPAGKFIYASSVAVLDPTSDYAKDKLECEAKIAGSGAIIVRAASVCGYSANMRFDITLNKMTHDAYKTGVITVNGGTQKRTHLHIDDLCDFYRMALVKAEASKTYTLWDTSQTIRESAEMVAINFDNVGKKISLDIKPRADDRSYELDWRGDKVLKEWLGSHRPVWKAIADMIARFDQGTWKDTTDEKMWRICRNLS